MICTNYWFHGLLANYWYSSKSHEKGINYIEWFYNFFSIKNARDYLQHDTKYKYRIKFRISVYSRNSILIFGLYHNNFIFLILHVIDYLILIIYFTVQMNSHNRKISFTAHTLHNTLLFFASSMVCVKFSSLTTTICSLVFAIN